MVKINKTFYKEIFHNSHLLEMNTTGILNEFISIKAKINNDKLHDQNTINSYLRGTVERFLSYSNKTFETDELKIENNPIRFIRNLADRCNDSFTTDDLKNYLFQFLKLIHQKDEEKGVTYENLQNVTCNQFGLRNVDFTKGVKFEKARNSDEIIPRGVKLPYDVGLDLCLTALIIPNEPDLHLDECTKKELLKLKQDFENCLNNMRLVATGEIRLSK